MPNQCPFCGGELSERFSSQVGDDSDVCYCLDCGKDLVLGPFKHAQELLPDQLCSIITEIQRLLWYSLSSDGKWVPEPDKEWDSETIEHVAGLLEQEGMKPEWVENPKPPPEPPMKVEGFKTVDEFLDRIEEINQQRAEAILDDFSDDEDMEPHDTVEGL
jgi:hypothetical protein